MTENSYSHISENLKRIEENISRAAEQSGRKRGDITLLAVTKTVPVEAISVAMDCGVKTFGENYVSELATKAMRLPRADLHMIGHLQTNKIRQMLPHISMLQSLDSIRLASALEKQLAKTNSRLDVLIEVNIGGEESKSGISPQQVDELAHFVSQTQFLRLRGLMCIPPFGENDKIKKYFEDMFNLYIDIRGKKRHNIDNIDILSMGMSDDYGLAIENGANLVRVGSAIFGKREKV